MPTKFELLQEIPYVIEAIDGSHILIIAHELNSTSYYCHKIFYSVLLHGVIDSNCNFWDYDFGWVRCCHDWTLFQLTEIGKRILKGTFLPYKLIGDRTYHMKLCFYSPFKGKKDGLSRPKFIDI